MDDFVTLKSKIGINNASAKQAAHPLFMLFMAVLLRKFNQLPRKNCLPNDKLMIGEFVGHLKTFLSVKIIPCVINFLAFFHHVDIQQITNPVFLRCETVNFRASNGTFRKLKRTVLQVEMICIRIV